MTDHEYLSKVICEQLDRGSPLVLASIVSQSGSSPRRSGTKMVIDADQKSYGTIGGGLLEARAIQQAQEILAGGQSKFMHFDLTNQNVNSEEMICGGKVTVLLDYIPVTEENITFSRCWHDAAIRGDDFSIFTFAKGEDDAITIVSRCLLFANGTMHGYCPLPKSDFESLLGKALNTSVTAFFALKDFQVAVDFVHKPKTLYCFGAGHVAEPTAHLAALVGFRVIVVDNLAEFADVERFPDAWEVRVIDDFNRALDGLKIDADSFIVILTGEHLYDRLVLEQALKTNAGYIGMIASRKKRDSIYKALRNKGVTDGDLARVHSPIGLPISAETPEEIAVSIVAEMIAEGARQV